MRTLGLIALAIVFVLPATAHAAQKKKSRFRGGYEVRGEGEKRVKEDGKTVIYNKKTEVDFDDSLIQGEVKNPSEFYFTVRPQSPAKNLIERRKNFHKEMLRDTVMIR